ILLQYQDRGKWNKELMQTGYFYLNKSSQGDYLSVYHVESAIAAEHCLAPSFAETNWQRMLDLYDLLLRIKATPVVKINMAIILAQAGKTAEAIESVLAIDNLGTLLQNQYMYSAVLGDLYLTHGDYNEAKKYLSLSLQLTTSEPEKKLLKEKLKNIAAAIT
ncbi:MAG TPA: hypothetical protein VHB48_14470, partial [Chitinophagaceae bacterium]|nr:hypothetical protein [Chitinophagaceae bacterium]